MGKTQKNFYVPGEELTPEEKEEALKASQMSEDEKRQWLKKKADDAIANKKVVDFMTDKFIPFEDRVLVFPDPVENLTAGGLYKPDSAVDKVKPMRGTVVAVGPGKESVNANAIVKALGYNADNIRAQMMGDYPSWNSDDFNALINNNKINLFPGDKIYYGNYAGTEFVINDIKYLIMRTADCFGEWKD
jgi:co-chaperonin GroES (HSP10)